MGDTPKVISSTATNNGIAPENQPRVMRIDCLFDTKTVLETDTVLAAEQEIFDNLQSALVDNTGNAADVTLEIFPVGYKVKVAAGKSAVIPVLSPSGSRITLTSTIAPANLTKLLLCNFPQPLCVF